jgi:hypothetical protein
VIEKISSVDKKEAEGAEGARSRIECGKESGLEKELEWASVNETHIIMYNRFTGQNRITESANIK